MIVDPETGRLVRASWRLPVYGIEACAGCLECNRGFPAYFDHVIEPMLSGTNLPVITTDPFPNVREQRPQPLPMDAVLDDGCSFNAQRAEQAARLAPEPSTATGG